MYTPRDLVTLTLFIGFLSKYNNGVFLILSRLLSDPMNICSVLVTFRLSLFAFSHSLILTRSLVANVIISLIHDPVVVILVSSAYILAVEYCRQ